MEMKAMEQVAWRSRRIGREAVWHIEMPVVADVVVVAVVFAFKSSSRTVN